MAGLQAVRSVVDPFKGNDMKQALHLLWYMARAAVTLAAFAGLGLAAATVARILGGLA